MSKRTEYDPRNCPFWCTAGTEQYPCHGEHSGESVWGYVPATAGLGKASPEGVCMPAVGVGAYWAEAYGEGRNINLHVVGLEQDLQLDLKLGEVGALIASLAEVLALIVDRPLWMGCEPILNAIGSLEEVRDLHMNLEVVA